MSALSSLAQRWRRHRAAAATARGQALQQRQAHRPAFDLFARIARTGHAEAQYHLARCYLLGLGVPPSLAQALRWLAAAAEAGAMKAQTQLAELALQGVGGERSTDLFACGIPSGAAPLWDRAERWSSLAAAAGSAEAQALLAFIRSEGPAEMRDLAAAQALYRQSAEGGWSRGQLGLARLLLREGAPEQTAEAVERLRASAADGLPIAHFLLGTLAETGASGSVDLAGAAEHYRLAAEGGHHPAQTRYGYALLYGHGLPRDVFAAETWLRRAAVGGETQAAAFLGFLYLNGEELRRDPAEAGLWLEQAAEGGNVTAMRGFARLLLRSKANWPRALNWLGRAADAGDQGAREDLMLLLRPAPEA